MNRDGKREEGDGTPTVLRYENRRLRRIEHRPVEEFPFSLNVNGVDLATLIASPHNPIFLVVGFLRMQGLVKSADDLLAVSVCMDSKVASVRIKGEAPKRVTPTLTSGCGTGVTFNIALPDSPSQGISAAGEGPVFSPTEVFAMMEGLARRAVTYRSRGGIHSSAVGDGRSILLYAEDIGRHNTLDRIAGEALLKDIDLAGKILVTSGRLSSEMVAKGASLGIPLIASRSSPTDMAVRIASELGITLAGYVRGGRFNVYSRPERVLVPSAPEKIAGITGVILAGGTSNRMGSHKALLPLRGGRLVERIHRQMAEIFEEVLLVTNTPELFDFLSCRKVADLLPGGGALSGIHSGLHHSATPHVFIIACDMPYLNGNLIRHLASLANESDVVIPEGDKGLEPLYAVYGKKALPAVEEALRADQARIVSFFDRVQVRKVERDEVSRFDPLYRCFRNINTPEEYFRFRQEGEAGAGGTSDAPEVTTV